MIPGSENPGVDVNPPTPSGLSATTDSWIRTFCKKVYFYLHKLTLRSATLEQSIGMTSGVQQAGPYIPFGAGPPAAPIANAPPNWAQLYWDASNLAPYWYDTAWHTITGGGGGTVTSITATTPVVVTPSPITGTGVISHAVSGVTAGTYGDSTHVAVPTVDAKGHITGITTAAISGSSGTVTSITATAPIIVTPSPITATGVITHDVSGVVAATYGDSTHYPIIAVDAKGHVTTASNQSFTVNNSEEFWFGDGSDGNLSVSSGTTTLARDTYWNNVTLTGTAIIKTSGFRMFALGVVDLTACAVGAIQVTGNPGVATGAGSSVGGAGGGAPWVLNNLAPLGTGSAGLTGGSSTTGAGGAASNFGAAIAIGNGGQTTASGVASGRGGQGLTSTQSGGLGGNGNNNTSPYAIRYLTAELMRIVGTTVALISGGCGNCGGGGGGGNTTQAGTGGGGGGGGAGSMALFLRTINRGASTPIGAISAKGGIGANSSNVINPNTGGGGGGGGGAGGWIYLCYKFLTGVSATSLVDASGAAAGNGGNGNGSGAGGTGGSGGNGGYIQAFCTATGTNTASGPGDGVGTAGTAGSGPTGVTGGAGGAGAACLLTL